jgi:hypothetical protein
VRIAGSGERPERNAGRNGVQALGGVNAAAAEYDLVREKKLALIVALQKNRGELSAEALKKLLASARA